MTQKSFSEYSKLYNLFNSSKDYFEESDYISRLLKAFSPSATNLLEFGSGTGIHASSLIDHGYVIHGVEQSPSMVDMCKSKEGFTCQVGDIRSLLLDNDYDAVISLFHVLSYQTSDLDVQHTFQSAFNNLKSNGIFIFDAWYSPAVYNIKPSIKVRHFQCDGIEAYRISTPTSKDNIVDVKFDFFYRECESDSFRHFTEYHSMRHFSLPEIKLFAQMTGFTLLHSEEFMTGAQPSPDSWGVTFILKKDS